MNRYVEIAEPKATLTSLTCPTTAISVSCPFPLGTTVLIMLTFITVFGRSTGASTRLCSQHPYYSVRNGIQSSMVGHHFISYIHVPYTCACMYSVLVTSTQGIIYRRCLKYPLYQVVHLRAANGSHK